MFSPAARHTAGVSVWFPSKHLGLFTSGTQSVWRCKHRDPFTGGRSLRRRAFIRGGLSEFLPPASERGWSCSSGTCGLQHVGSQKRDWDWLENTHTHTQARPPTCEPPRTTSSSITSRGRRLSVRTTHHQFHTEASDLLLSPPQLAAAGGRTQYEIKKGGGY